MTTAPIFNFTDTWNDAGVTYSAIKVSITDTASAAGSKLIDFEVGGVSQASIGKDGGIICKGLTSSLNIDLQGNRLVMDGDNDTYLEASTDDRLDFVVGGTLVARFDANAVDTFQLDGVGFSPTGAVVGQALGYPNSPDTLEPYTPAGGGDLLAAANETVTGDYNFTGALQKSGASVYAIGDTVPISDGGTGATTAAAARTALAVPGLAANETVTGNWNFTGDLKKDDAPVLTTKNYALHTQVGLSWVNGETLDLDKTGVEDIHTKLEAAYDNGANAIYLPKGQYLLAPSQQQWGERRKLMGDGEDTVLKMGDPPSGTTDIIFVGTGGAGSEISNMTFDGQKAAYVDQWNTGNTQYSGFRGLRSAGDGVRIEHVLFKDFLGVPLWQYGNNIIARYITARTSAAGLNFGNEIGVGQTWDNAVLENIAVFDMDTDLTGKIAGALFPHALDILGFRESRFSGLKVERQDANSSDSASPQISALTALHNQKCHFSDISIKDLLYRDGAHAVLTLPDNYDCTLTSVLIENCTGNLIEAVGGQRNLVQGFHLDGKYFSDGQVFNQIETASYGIKVEHRSTDWDGDDRLHNSGGIGWQFMNGLIRACGRGYLQWGGRAKLSAVDILNNYDAGVHLAQSPSSIANNLFDEFDARMELDMSDCLIANNGAEGIRHQDGVLRRRGNTLKNNNQRNAAAAEHYTGPASSGASLAADRARRRLDEVGESFSSTTDEGDYARTPVTVADAISFDAVSTTSTKARYADNDTAVHILEVANLRPVLLDEGLTITLKGATTGGGDATGRIIEVTSDVMTLAFSSAVTLDPAEVLTTLGTPTADNGVAGQTTLQFTGTTLNDSIPGATWVRDGSGNLARIYRLFESGGNTFIVVKPQLAASPGTVSMVMADVELFAQDLDTPAVTLSRFCTNATKGHTWQGYGHRLKQSWSTNGILAEKGSELFASNLFEPSGVSTSPITPTNLPPHNLISMDVRTEVQVGAGGATFMSIFAQDIDNDPLLTIAAIAKAAGSEAREAVVTTSMSELGTALSFSDPPTQAEMNALMDKLLGVSAGSRLGTPLRLAPNISSWDGSSNFRYSLNSGSETTGVVRAEFMIQVT